MKLKMYLLLIAVFAIVCFGLAQNGTGSVKVLLTDASDKSPIPFGNIVVYQHKMQIATGTTDIDGYAFIKQLKPGKYDIKALYVGYQTKAVKDVVINADKTTYFTITMYSGVQLNEVVISYSPPLIDPNTVFGGTVTRENFQQMANKSISSVVSTQAGVYSSDSYLNLRGSRGSGEGNVFIDGERVIGSKYQTNNEAYGEFKENVFSSAGSQPLSTFAIDVDGASYSNVRRVLQRGYLPDKHMVRVEEFINYFNYNYPKPKENEPFSITTEYASCPWNKEHGLLQVGIKGKEIDAAEEPATHLVFLIDVSGSMDSDDKLPLLKRAFKLLIKQLRDQDRLSIVVYAGNSGLILENQKGGEKEKMFDALDALSAGGSTAGGEGINLAYKIAEKHFLKNGNNRVILATDGDFNVGVSSVDELKKLIEEKTKLGVYLSVLGFGEGNIKDNIMETLADKGNGNYYYIDNFSEARKVLVSQFGGTLYAVAKDVKIQVEFNPALVKEYRLVGYDNRMLNAEDFKDDKKDAGELGSGHCVTALYEIIPSGSKESLSKIDELKYSQVTATGNSGEVATVKFRYKDVNKQDTTSKLIEHPVENKLTDFTLASADFKLAMGISEFGMLLRESEYKGGSTFKEALELVHDAKANDTNGYVSGLIDLMKTARELKEESLTRK